MTKTIEINLRTCGTAEIRKATVYARRMQFEPFVRWNAKTAATVTPNQDLRDKLIAAYGRAVITIEYQARNTGSSTDSSSQGQDSSDDFDFDSTDDSTTDTKKADVKRPEVELNLSQLGSLGETITDAIKRAMDSAMDHADAAAAAASGGQRTPNLVIKVNTKQYEASGDKPRHCLFKHLLLLASTRNPDGTLGNYYLYGPAGSGKTTAAKQVADTLGMSFYFTSAVHDEFKLTGFVNAGGSLVRSTFRDAYENGGVFLFDEIDRSNPSAVAVFNAALANGHMDFPDGKVERHKDCLILAAGNTVGLGGDAEYSTAQKLDGASTDRFEYLHFPVDETMERAATPREHDGWLEIVRSVRRKAAEVKLRGRPIATPRSTFRGVTLLSMTDETTGQPLYTRNEVIDLTIRKGLPKSAWDKIKPTGYQPSKLSDEYAAA